MASTFVSPTDGSALFNGRPADVQRISWRAGGGGTTAFVRITCPFDPTDGSPTVLQSIAAKCCALIMPNLSTAVPADVKVTFSGLLNGSPVALGGNSVTTRTQTLPNGATAIWCVFPAATIDTLIVTIYNDQNGSTWATGGQHVDLGEIWVGKGADFNVANDIKIENMGGILQRRSHNNQAWPLEVQPFRQMTVQLVPMPESVAIGPNSAQDDYETVANALSTQSACVIIPSYLNRGPVNGNSATNGAPPPTIDSTTISIQRLHRTACLGVLGGESGTPIIIQANGEQFYTSPIVFGETPP